LITSDCLNYGVNLQFCHNLIHFDLQFSPAKIEQREGRIDRIGSEANKLLIFKLIIEDSVEDRVLELLEQKQKLFFESVEKDVNTSLFKELFRRLKE
jgi:SNF2 family DNA or RNA helicase